MQLYLIRHGQSENNQLFEYTGSSLGRSPDPELTTVGRQQAALVAGFLQHSDPTFANQAHDPQNVAGFDITHVYCSLMVRAVATGVIIAHALGLPLVGLRDAHETTGIYMKDPETGVLTGLPGKTREYFAAHYPDLILPDDVDNKGWWNRPVEEDVEIPPRAQRLFDLLLSRHSETEDHIALVTHGGFYSYLLAAILGQPLGPCCRFVMNNAGITRIDCAPNRIRVIYMNRVDFLPRALIT
ncbi:MAG TPA: histidine phosphatase family protein [Anaerolineae bacterium]|nr:histidine phosphatase family protein [Anaerolineae bacterium]HQH38732.1 histidine phosphatase family protein [Anaerolineae bacterium]